MKILFMLLSVVFFFAQPARAGLEEKSIGVGFIVGEPTGISFKKWTSKINAIDGAISWSLVDENRFILQIGFLKHNFEEFHVEQGKLPFYYGAGARLKLSERVNGKDDNRLGVRGVIGMSYIFEVSPLEAFIEIGPVIDIVPFTEISVTGGLGVRYYFR